MTNTQDETVTIDAENALLYIINHPYYDPNILGDKVKGNDSLAAMSIDEIEGLVQEYLDYVIQTPAAIPFSEESANLYLS